MPDSEDTPVTTPQPGEMGPISPEDQERNAKVDDMVIRHMEQMPGGYPLPYLVKQLDKIGVGTISPSEDDPTNRNIILESLGRLVKLGKVYNGKDDNNHDYWVAANIEHPESDSGFNFVDRTDEPSHSTDTPYYGGSSAAAAGGGLPGGPGLESWLDSHPGPSGESSPRV